MNKEMILMSLSRMVNRKWVGPSCLHEFKKQKQTKIEVNSLHLFYVTSWHIHLYIGEKNNLCNWQDKIKNEV